MAIVEIPLLNSENFYPVGVDLLPGYHTKHFLTDWWQETLYYFQKFNKFYDNDCPQYFVLKEFTDRVCIQIDVPETYIGVNLVYVDSDGEIQGLTSVAASTMTVTGDEYNGIQMTRYQFDLLMSDNFSTEQKFFWLLDVFDETAATNKYISEPVWVKEEHEDTILIEYRHSKNDYDVIFVEMSASFSHRLKGNLTFTNNKLERTVFRSQTAKLRQLYARNWRLYKLELGFPTDGVNDVDIDKLANIQKCDEVYYDGKRLILAEGAEIEVSEFGSRYPLRVATIDLEEYDQKNSSVFESGGEVYIMPLGAVIGFPYLITSLSLSGVGSPGDPFPDFMLSYIAELFSVEILDSAAETAMIAQLNADAAGYGITGIYHDVSDYLYFARGTGETYVLNSISQLIKPLRIDYATTPTDTTQTITVNQLGLTVMSTRRLSDDLEVIPRYQYTGDFSEILDIPAPAYDDYYMYIYCDNQQSTISISNIGKTITAVAGQVSAGIQQVSITGGDISSFDAAFLRSAASTLKGYDMIDMGISTIDAATFTIINTSDWKQLNRWSFELNDFNVATCDSVYNDFYSNIASFYLGAFGDGAGTISVINQTTADNPGAGSLTSRIDLLALGYYPEF